MTEDMMKQNAGYEMDAPVDLSGVTVEDPPVDLKKERKFCSKMGMNYFWFFLIANGLQILVTALIGALNPDMIINNYALYMILAMAPMYVIGVPVLWALCKRQPAVKLEQHKMKFGSFMILLMMCFGVMIIGNIIGLIVNAVIGLITGTPVINSVEVMLGSSTVWANILIAGICAPIFEELMFRKFLVDRMVRYGEATAIVVSSLMFGLFHGNFSQFFYAAALGCFFAFVYVKTSKLRYPIIIHMIINMSSTLMLPIIQMIDMEALNDLSSASEMILQGNASTGLMNDMMASMMDMIVPLMILMLYEMVIYGMAIAGIILLIIKRKQFTCKAGEVTLPKGKRASVVWFNVGMILFTVCCLALFVLTIASS